MVTRIMQRVGNVLSEVGRLFPSDGPPLRAAVYIILLGVLGGYLSHLSVLNVPRKGKIINSVAFIVCKNILYVHELLQ